MWSGMFDGLGVLIYAVFIAVPLCIILFVYGLYVTNKKTFKTEEKPAISWELKSKGQSVDTVWIYKFK